MCIKKFVKYINAVIKNRRYTQIDFCEENYGYSIKIYADAPLTVPRQKKIKYENSANSLYIYDLTYEEYLELGGETIMN